MELEPDAAEPAQGDEAKAGRAMKLRAPLAVTLGLALAGLAFAACSGIDPTPPDPHEHPDAGDPPPDGDPPDGGVG